MFASTGMRVEELIRLDMDGVDIQGRKRVVTGKGNKQRSVHFDARMKMRYAMVNQSNVKASHEKYLS